MDIHFSPEEVAFREEVRTFLKANLPADVAARINQGKSVCKADQVLWMRTLNEKGWLAASWPVEQGGTGWSAVQKHIFDEECSVAGAPRIVPFGVNMVGPVIIKFGTAEQKAHYLPRILNCEDWWCQGYSEPGAGSDLASLRTRAVREGDDYIVNGQKTWTSTGHMADWMFCLVRTDAEAQQQRGISFLLIDMKSPGITVRPIITLDGGHYVNEVFLDNVRVPVQNLVGRENEGWTCAKYLLTHERTTIAGIGIAKAMLSRLKQVARAEKRNGKPLIEDPQFATRMAKVEIELLNMATTNLRVIASVADGGVPGAESSMLKIKGTVIRQELLSLIRRAMGPYALPFIEEAQFAEYADAPVGPAEAATAAAAYFNYRKLSIFGGSNEIQRNIISKMILGL